MDHEKCEEKGVNHNRHGDGEWNEDEDGRFSGMRVSDFTMVLNTFALKTKYFFYIFIKNE
jgi:hypothetical protein